MKNLIPLLFVLLLLTPPGCRQEKYEINVIEAEGWTDLMPNAGGKTYLRLQIKIEDTREEKLNISGLSIRHGEDHYNLSEGEFNYNVENDEKSLLVEIKADFLLRENGEEEINAGIEFSLGGNSEKFMIEDIPLEKIH